ncbi:hypothetical protein GJ496_009216 [Pomphorhynchus laevis]|nr:hypothetical protein GJ496_009216 [Pomphorhynchus laevis]
MLLVSTNFEKSSIDTISNEALTIALILGLWAFVIRKFLKGYKSIGNSDNRTAFKFRLGRIYRLYMRIPCYDWLSGCLRIILHQKKFTHFPFKGKSRFRLSDDAILLNDIYPIINSSNSPNVFQLHEMTDRNMCRNSKSLDGTTKYQCCTISSYGNSCSGYMSMSILNYPKCSRPTLKRQNSFDVQSNIQSLKCCNTYSASIDLGELTKYQRLYLQVKSINQDLKNSIREDTNRVNGLYHCPTINVS